MDNLWISFKRNGLLTFDRQGSPVRTLCNSIRARPPNKIFSGNFLTYKMPWLLHMVLTNIFDTIYRGDLRHQTRFSSKYFIAGNHRRRYFYIQMDNCHQIQQRNLIVTVFALIFILFPLNVTLAISWWHLLHVFLYIPCNNDSFYVEASKWVFVLR